MRRSGFTLIELSIVLVIIGLIVGGVLVGQSLIKASQLRSVIRDYDSYRTAVNTFRLKYNCLPGDCPNATTYWGLLTAGAGCPNQASTGAETCNGDGDKYIEISTGSSREAHRFWQHLANAGLVAGQYTGTYNSTAGAWGMELGVNAPTSKIPGVGFGVLTRGDLPIGGFYNNVFPPTHPNWFELGKVPFPNSNNMANLVGLRSVEAYDIDTKIDDGKPGTGNVTTTNNTWHSFCASSDVAGSAIYHQLTLNYAACVMFFGF